MEPPNQQSNPFSNLHRQKLYPLIIAFVALITLFPPWVTAGFFGSLGFHGSVNGFRGWGIFSLLGILGVVVAAFAGSKTIAYDDTMRKVTPASFGAIALGALIFVLTKSSSYGPLAGTGIGTWICLIVGLSLGLVKIPEK